MATHARSGSRHDLLEHLMDRLEHDADSFEPARELTDAAVPPLPGRQPGVAAKRPTPPVGAAAVLLDCGISRRTGYTHVLWVSVSAEAILGSHGYARLETVICALDEVTAYQWEGLDRLHVRAPGEDWDDLLREARSVVDGLIA